MAGPIPSGSGLMHVRHHHPQQVVDEMLSRRLKDVLFFGMTCQQLASFRRGSRRRTVQTVSVPELSSSLAGVVDFHLHYFERVLGVQPLHAKLNHGIEIICHKSCALCSHIQNRVWNDPVFKLLGGGMLATYIVVMHIATRINFSWPASVAPSLIGFGVGDIDISQTEIETALAWNLLVPLPPIGFDLSVIE